MRHTQPLFSPLPSLKLAAMTDETIYKIDPNADTVIILKNPNVSLAPWSATLVEKPASQDGPVEERTIEETARDTERRTSYHAAAFAQSLSKTDLAEHQATEKEISFYVSSRHLALSSHKFKSMLSERQWKEGIPNEEDGLFHVTTEEWDIQALLLLLNVLHHRNRQVPRKVSLETLAKVAVLVDYYECAEALELYTEIWIADLKVNSPIPLDFCRDLLLWMCIAWVFKLPREFSQTTRAAIRRHDQELSTLGLPIGTCVGRFSDFMC